MPRGGFGTGEESELAEVGRGSHENNSPRGRGAGTALGAAGLKGSQAPAAPRLRRARRAPG